MGLGRGLDSVTYCRWWRYVLTVASLRSGPRMLFSVSLYMKRVWSDNADSNRCSYSTLYHES